MPSLPTYEKDVLDQAKRAPERGAFDEDAEAVGDPLEDSYYDYLIRLGDDSLILGQRLSEWCGHAPALEVDLSLANLALDLIGQATHLYEHANNGDADAIAFHRDVLDFKNCLLVEQPNGDFAQTMARHLLYTTWQHMLLQRLQKSSDRFLVEFVRVPDAQIGYLAFGWLTMGQVLSLPLIALGLFWLFVWSRRQPTLEPQPFVPAK